MVKATPDAYVREGATRKSSTARATPIPASPTAKIYLRNTREIAGVKVAD